MRDRVSRCLDRQKSHPRPESEARPRAFQLGSLGSASIPNGIQKPLWSLLLVMMMGLTCWAVATVSIWLVPAYLGIMVLLLGSPQENQSGDSSSKSDLDQGKGRAVSASRSRSSAAGNGLETGSETDLEPRPEVSAQPSESAKSGPRGGKPRNSRGRPRKSAAKGVVGASAEPAPATWIRIGPGKFVRADADPGAFVDAASVTQTGGGPLDPDNGPSPIPPTELELVPELESDPGCQGIAPSALGSIEVREPAPTTVEDSEIGPDLSSISLEEDWIEDAQADTTECVSTDLDADLDLDIRQDDEIDEVVEAEHDAWALEREDPEIENVSESLGDEVDDDHLSDSEADLRDDLLPERPIPAEDPCASGADDAEFTPDEESWDEEQSSPVSADETEPSLESRLVPSQRTASIGPLSARHWPRRVLRHRDVVDNFRRSRTAVSVPGPRDHSSAPRAQLRISSDRASCRGPRIRRRYRPRSPPFRHGRGSSHSNRVA